MPRYLLVFHLQRVIFREGSDGHVLRTIGQFSDGHSEFSPTVLLVFLFRLGSSFRPQQGDYKAELSRKKATCARPRRKVQEEARSGVLRRVFHRRHVNNDLRPKTPCTQLEAAFRTSITFSFSSLSSIRDLLETVLDG